MHSTRSEPEHHYARNDDVVTREILGETLLVPISSSIADMSNIFALNETGAYVWQQLDGTAPLADVRDRLTLEFDVTPDTAWEDLDALLNELVAAGLAHRVTGDLQDASQSSDMSGRT